MVTMMKMQIMVEDEDFYRNVPRWRCHGEKWSVKILGIVVWREGVTNCALVFLCFLGVEGVMNPGSTFINQSWFHGSCHWRGCRFHCSCEKSGVKKYTLIYPIKRKWDHLSLTRYRLWITQNFNASMDSILNKHAPRCLPRPWGRIAGEESRYWTQTVWCNTPAASKPTARSHWKTKSALGWIVLLWNEPNKFIEEPV